MIFKKYLNKSPFEYIEEQRLLKAYELIKQHKQSKRTTDIAREVGFRHLGRFSLNFKKRFGIHPSILAKSNTK
jgi:AraC-like DNA-binding protein